MKSSPAQDFFGRVDRREVIGAAALSSLATVAVQVASPAVAGAAGTQTVPLWPGVPPGGEGLNLSVHVEERSPDPQKFHERALSGIGRPSFRVIPATSPTGSALLIIPGGGYRELTIDTALAAAKRFAQAGVTGFVLYYRLPHEGWRDAANVPLQDAMRAMRLVRANPTRYGIDAARLGVLGFSAGGHVAAMLSLRSDTEPYAAVDAADRENARPDLAALLYPVITMLPPYAHEASREMLLGSNPTLAERAAWSCERLVRRGAPPTFVAAAADDPDVPVENTLEMFAALRRAAVASEMHIFERGGHGFALGNPGEPLSAWPGLLLNWVHSQGAIRP
ncbi:MAG TPA: alpha/beta hydrolase [Rhizomicrobium sp.]|nr:alpha/beta hydrolase [Rhizomicrobium sp.]